MEDVPADTVVIEIHGLCPAAEVSQAKPESCVTKLTRAQFETMLSALGVNNRTTSVAAMRSLAESYVQLMALAAAAEKAGIDKEPRFTELMKVVRVRTLADVYRRSLEERFGNPSDDEIAAYYNANKEKFEELRLDRLFLPRVNPKLLPAQQLDFARKAARVAEEMRARAINGEDIGKLQNEASKVLGVGAPAGTDIGAKRRGSLPPAIEKDVFALKGGEVTRLEIEPSGYNFYKLRSRDTMPLQLAKNEIVRELSRKNLEAAMKAATGTVHADLNEKFFKPAQSRTPAQMTLPPGSNNRPVTMPPGSTFKPGIAPGAPAPGSSSTAGPK
jgi:parvulin-like peptidyl-prolyl cis-trans isomerase-like protein